MAVGGVDNDDIGVCVQERLGAGDPRVADAGRSADAKPAVLVLAGMWAARRLLDVLDRNQADAAVVVIDDQELLDAVFVQEPFRLLAVDTVAHGNERLFRLVAGHQLAHRLQRIVGEADIAVGENAKQPVGAVFDHRYAGKLVLAHQRQRIGKVGVGADRHRIDDHPEFVLLHPTHFRRLVLGRHVLVDDAETPGLGHGDGERALGHGVHCRRNQRQGKSDTRRQPGPGVDLGRQDLRGGRHQEHIIERQRFRDVHAASSSRDGATSYRKAGPCQASRPGRDAAEEDFRSRASRRPSCGTVALDYDNHYGAATGAVAVVRPSANDEG